MKGLTGKVQGRRAPTDASVMEAPATILCGKSVDNLDERDVYEIPGMTWWCESQLHTIVKCLTDCVEGKRIKLHECPMQECHME